MTPINNLNQVLSTLEGIDTDACRGVMSDYDSFMHRIQQKIFIQTFISHYKHAEKSYEKENETGEKKSLIFALNLIHSEIIKNQDLKDEDLHDYITGAILATENIEMRLRELGIDN
jgi:hypothetical protein